MALRDDFIFENFTKEFLDEHGRSVTTEYDIHECYPVRFTFFTDLTCGLYTYVISTCGNMTVAKVIDKYEHGSKHLQLVHESKYNSFLTGGEILIYNYQGVQKILYNVYSGLFEKMTDHNIEYHRLIFFKEIDRIFNRYVKSNVEEYRATYTMDQLITPHNLSRVQCQCCTQTSQRS